MKWFQQWNKREESSLLNSHAYRQQAKQGSKLKNVSHLTQCEFFRCTDCINKDSICCAIMFLNGAQITHAICSRWKKHFRYASEHFWSKGFSDYYQRLELKENKKMNIVFKRERRLSGSSLHGAECKDLKQLQIEFMYCCELERSFFTQRRKFQYILHSKFMNDFKLQSTQCPKRAQLFSVTWKASKRERKKNSILICLWNSPWSWMV